MDHRLLFKTILFAAALFLAPGQARAQCFFNVVNDFICPGMATEEPENPFIPAELIPPPEFVPVEPPIFDAAAAYAKIQAAQAAAGVAGPPITPGSGGLGLGLPGGAIPGGLPGGIPGLPGSTPGIPGGLPGP